jgi:uncharacterized damage-inducible protein DinB
MDQVRRWFDRKFEFSFPSELLPNLCMRLRGTPARLEEIVAGQPRSILIQRDGTKWSIQEHAGHLLDLEALWNDRIGDFIKGSAQLTAADLSNRPTDDANHNARDIREILGNFRRARFQLVERAETLNREVLTHTILHPRLQQPMRIVDHLYFAAEHDDHHLARMWELMRR